ncbi:MAG: bifunctional phosphopantothenoylcysteine decarboxylase/phosphopantothenate--cysteine ligase CoaBC [Rikenellaceae bacterium]
MLKGKKILLGITGSIAAYKAAMLVRVLVKQGAEVQVIMTSTAKQFITPLTMATLSKRPILVEFFDPENGMWNSHVSLGEWADCYLIAPATAATIAKMANGVADNLLVTSYLSARCDVFVAPAMDLDMFKHESTTKNINTLRSYGNHIIEPEAGELASGLEGKGRMAEPEHIADYLVEHFKKKSNLKGKTFMVTAGATIEPIDPVRFISNHSSGKMGYALAGELASRGATVKLISGAATASVPSGVELIKVSSAEHMYNTAMEVFETVDGAVLCAAVADYTPEHVSDFKIKKSADQMSIALKPTKDIAKCLGAIKNDKLLVGFALETDNELVNAQSKLECKNFDFIVLNSMQNDNACFGVDNNRISIIDATSKVDFETKSKREVAADIVDKIESLIR